MHDRLERRLRDRNRCPYRFRLSHHNRFRLRFGFRLDFRLRFRCHLLLHLNDEGLGLSLRSSPPVESFCILGFQLLKQWFKGIDPVAMDPLAEQPIHARAITLGQGLAQGQNVGLAAGLR